jgi:uncharacterized protein YuzE
MKQNHRRRSRFEVFTDDELSISDSVSDQTDLSDPDFADDTCSDHDEDGKVTGMNRARARSMVPLLSMYVTFMQRQL